MGAERLAGGGGGGEPAGAGEAPARHIPRGSVLFRAGDPCGGFVLLEAGTIRVSLGAPSGREIVLYRVGPGEICLQTFTCLVEGRLYSAEGVAETDLSARLLPPPAFRRRLAEDEVFRDAVFAAVAHRFTDFEQLVEDVALTGFAARLARALLRLADASGAVHATHEALAAETGSARAVVSRQLARFADRGWVDQGRGHVRIADRPALAALAARG